MIAENCWDVVIKYFIHLWTVIITKENNILPPAFPFSYKRNVQYYASRSVHHVTIVCTKLLQIYSSGVII